MHIKILSVLFFVILMSACTTIHFDKRDEAPTGQAVEKWHHNVALALVEVSDPVDLKGQCQDKEWASVKTEFSFINGLAQFAVSAILPGVWYPKTVTISCK